MQALQPKGIRHSISDAFRLQLLLLPARRETPIAGEGLGDQAMGTSAAFLDGMLEQADPTPIIDGRNRRYYASCRDFAWGYMGQRRGPFVRVLELKQDVYLRNVELGIRVPRLDLGLQDLPAGCRRSIER